MPHSLGERPASTLCPFESGWYRALIADVGSAGGAYVVRAVDESERPAPIGRLFGTDPHGVLYIGLASRFVSRAAELLHGLEHAHKPCGHGFVRRYRRLRMAQALPLERIRVDLYVSGDPKRAEKDRLAAYEAQWGELPPFNRSG